MASGYSAYGQLEETFEMGALGSLNPYEVSQLLNTVRRVLDETKTSVSSNNKEGLGPVQS